MVQVERQVAQTSPLQPLEDHLDLGALLGDDDLAAGVRQDLGSPKPGRSGADDQDFNRIHAGSPRRRSAIAARSVADGFGVMPVCRSTARPRL